ncbi:helix-turn-helix domain-containing protein [Litoreibacter roseus]|uniref:Transcriptional regulator n=1 Tax=Litoreibacter roseus TaxID=2601869 RepID=A0A6N6JD94_9RHOB|nr:helix-turn-helix transcriptional regulator [Litoreibacter roseus]GFE63800.1 transcriptional regulator [Litoreibacter roseus]
MHSASKATQPPAKPFPSFGQRLRRQRRALGLKQLALADQLGVDQTSVSRWEAGHHTPDAELQHRAFDVLARSRKDDAALRRLVENSIDCVHLVEEVSHICLAYSKSRAADWKTSQRTMLGISLWQFATDEIRNEEAKLADAGWWSTQVPEPRLFCTSGAEHDLIRISAGGILWERLYLADGTPVRLVTGA